MPKLCITYWKLSLIRTPIPTVIQIHSFTDGVKIRVVLHGHTDASFKWRGLSSHESKTVIIHGVVPLHVG